MGYYTKFMYLVIILLLWVGGVKLLHLNNDIKAMSTELGIIRNENEKLVKLVDDQKVRIESLEKEKKSLQQESNYLKDKVKTSSNRVVTKDLTSRGFSTINPTFYVIATAYTPNCKGCTGITKTGVNVRKTKKKIIAVDPRVIPLKSKVELIVDGKSWGYYYAEDIGGKIKGYRIDVLMRSYTQAKNFGRKKVKVRVIK